MHTVGGLGTLAAIGHARLHRAVGRTIALRTSPLIHLGRFLNGCHNTFLPFFPLLYQFFRVCQFIGIKQKKKGGYHDGSHPFWLDTTLVTTVTGIFERE